MSNVYKLLYGINFTLETLLTKKGKKYLRFRDPDLRPKNKMNNNEDWECGQNGISSFLTFINAKTVLLTTWDYNVFKPTKQLLKSKGFTKKYLADWKKTTWKVRYSPGPERFILKKTKEGKLKGLYIAKNKRTPKRFKYIKDIYFDSRLESFIERKVESTCNHSITDTRLVKQIVKKIKNFALEHI